MRVGALLALSHHASVVARESWLDGLKAVTLPCPDSSRYLSCEPDGRLRFGLEFRQYSLHHAPLPLTILRETILLWTALSNDALFTAPFRALLHCWRRLTLVGTGDVSTPGFFKHSSSPLTRRTLSRPLTTTKAP